MLLKRRALIATLAYGAAGGALACAGRALAQARPKLTKAAAAYQDHPNDIFECDNCSLFHAPKACDVVEGEVSPKGWCKLYSLVD